MTKTIHLNIKDFVKLNKVGKGTFGDLFLLKSVKTGEIYAGKFTIGSKSNTDSANKLSKEINITKLFLYHGTKLNKHALIATSQFIHPDENDANNITDDGYFGKGIYATDNIFLFFNVYNKKQ